MFYLLFLSCNVVDCSSVNSGVIPKLSIFCTVLRVRVSLEQEINFFRSVLPGNAAIF